MTGSSTISCDGIRWTVVDGWAEYITGSDAPDWSALAIREPSVPAETASSLSPGVSPETGCDPTGPGAILVKSNPTRRVWSIPIKDRRFFVKVYMGGSMASGIRRALRGSDARPEWRAGRWAEHNGVPTVCFVATGGGGGSNFLVSEAVHGARTLSEAWLAGADKWHLLQAVASLLATAHGAGFLHGDEHPNNILVSRTDDAGFIARYVDIHSARFGGVVSRSDVAESLAQLNQWFRPRSPRRLRLRFLGEYCLRRSGGCASQACAMMRNLGPIVGKTSHRQENRRWRKHDQRILGSNRYFTARKGDTGHYCHRVIRFRQPDLFPSPSVHPDAVASAWECRVGDEIEGTVRRTCASMLESGIKKPADLGGSLALHAFVTGHRLRHRDLPCRWPIALDDCDDELAGAVWFDASPAAEGLVEFLRSSGDSRSARRRVMVSLATVVSSMSDRGVSVSRCGSRTFCVVSGSGSVMIDDPLNVSVDDREPDRDVCTTSRAIYELVESGSLFRGTDAVCYLKAITGNQWKPLWRRIATMVKKC